LWPASISPAAAKLTFRGHALQAHGPPEALASRSGLLLTYAMCRFANFGSLGILLGGMGAMGPQQQRGEPARPGVKSIGAGVLATALPRRWWA
jgi:CNT family concentrative nucleoside transporter